MAAIEPRVLTISTLYKEIAAFLVSSPNLEQLTDFHLSDMSDEFISMLLEAERTRGLTPDEKAFLDGFYHIDHLMRRVKLEALTKLKQISEAGTGNLANQP